MGRPNCEYCSQWEGSNSWYKDQPEWIPWQIIQCGKCQSQKSTYCMIPFVLNSLNVRTIRMENKLVGAKQLGMEALKGQPGGALGCWTLLCCAGGGDADLVVTLHRGIHTQGQVKRTRAVTCSVSVLIMCHRIVFPVWRNWLKGT